MSLPNIISIARLLSVPVVIYLIMAGYFTATFWLFVAAAASDAVDGYLAKRLEQYSKLGAYLDPIADKVLLVGVYVALGQVGQLANWVVILVLFRDLVIVGAVLLLHANPEPVRMKPLFLSKINTVAQLVLVTVVLAKLGIGLDFGVGERFLVYYVGLTTVVSGGAYVVEWSNHTAWLEDRR